MHDKKILTRTNTYAQSLECVLHDDFWSAFSENTQVMMKGDEKWGISISAVVRRDRIGIRVFGEGRVGAR